MESRTETRTERKRKQILNAATSVFLEQGYDRTSMDDVAVRAGVSKPTVYKYFADKERLFAAIVNATTDQVDGLVRLITDTLAESDDLDKDLGGLARRFLHALMQPEMLRLRRLVIANADRFPEVGRTWYEQGFERVLASLATCFQRLADRELLRHDDPFLAANHFVGLLLWIPINRAMFCSGGQAGNASDLNRSATGAVRAFLNGYGRFTRPAPPASSRSKADSKSADRR